MLLTIFALIPIVVACIIALLTIFIFVTALIESVKEIDPDGVAMLVGVVLVIWLIWAIQYLSEQ